MQFTSKSRLTALVLLVALNLCAAPLAFSQVAQPTRERRVEQQTAATSAETRPATSGVATTSAPRTLEDLQSRIAELARRPELAQAQFAVKVSSLDTNRTLFEENAQKLLLPASVMKIYTVAAALDRLTPDFRFKTSVYADSKPDASGTIKGNLVIYGRGDPSISATFNNGDYFKAVRELADSIAAAGVKRVEGDLVGDESYFTGPPHGFAWSWADLQWYYGAEVSALSVNNNALDLFVKPGPEAGSPCLVTTGPPVPIVTINNRATTAPRGAKRALAVYRALGENVVEVTGSLPVDDQGYTGSISVSHPALVFVYMLRSALAERGVTVTGKSTTVNAPSSQASSFAQVGIVPSSQRVEITSRLSPPLSVIAAQTLKPSQNLYAELILRTLGRERGTGFQGTSEAAGIDVVRKFLAEAGVNPYEVVMWDGSGLSRRDLITANATVQLLTYMSRHRYASVFREALPVAGVDGTLARRMKNTPAMSNARAKTGTIETVATLSGYVTSAAGERLVFSVLLNNYPESSGARRVFTDDLTVLLASFAGRSQ
ncbi:MAG TPA: D-alanyl-D-alanine carboxypeptidase/D-alanyl-D-alanine-endopeptidase [Pyrinomonadaceae bacterium]|nr:D-alanyl-D-alanine carboxypeptidase/D-alanyl-D-alanine-endopeptidase [Pyrinomonadaceae bacterium]